MMKPEEQEFRPPVGGIYGGGPGLGHGGPGHGGPGFGHGGPGFGHGFYPHYGYGVNNPLPWIIAPYLYGNQPYYPYPPAPYPTYPYPPSPYYPPVYPGIYTK